MDSGQLTTARKLLLMHTKLKAFLKPWSLNIDAHWNHLGSSKNRTSHPTPPSHLISPTSLLCVMSWEVGFKKKKKMFSRWFYYVARFGSHCLNGRVACVFEKWGVPLLSLWLCHVESFSFNFLKITQPKSKQTVKTEKFWKNKAVFFSFPQLIGDLSQLNPRSNMKPVS